MLKMCSAICASAFVLYSGVATNCTTGHAESNSGWWVVLGSVASPDNSFTPQNEIAVRRIETAARRWGIKPFQDFSSKFFNFTQGCTVVVAGAYGSKASANQVLAKAKECLENAYVKQGSYAGE
jgi:hypothetical protein